MLVEVLKPNQFDNYSNLIDKVEATMLYHQLNYIQFVAELLSAEVEVFGIFQDTNLVAACPWIVKQGKYGKVYNSLAYYGANGGIIAISNKFKQALEAQMMPAIAKSASTYAYTSNLLEDNTLQSTDKVVQNRLAQVTHLPSENTEEALMEIFHFKTRNMVRKGLKENIAFQKTRDFQFLYQTHVENMDAVGVTPKNKTFFEILDRYFEYGKDYEIFEALIDDDQAAAVLVFYHKNTVEYYMPAINVTHRNKQPLSALIYHVMGKCIEKGFKLWNWGGTPLSNENLYRFKNRFGANDYPYTIQIGVFNTDILSHTPQEIGNQYSGMFVVPFDMLKG